MNINKEVFSEHLKNKDYIYCTNEMRREIIDILVKRIQEKNPGYKYINTKALKVDCFRYLSDIEQDIAIELYDLEIVENTAYYELSRLLDLYKDLI